MRKIIFTFFILILGQAYLSAQSYEINRLEERLKTAKDANEIIILDKLSEAYLDYDTEKSIDLAKNALKKSKIVEISSKTKASLYNTMGAAYFYKKKYKKSLKYYDKELDIIKKTSSPKEITKAYYNIAVLYQKSGKERRAVKNYEISLGLAKRNGYSDLEIYIYKGLYDLYKDWEKYEYALDNLQHYLAIRDNANFNNKKRQITILRRKYKKEKILRRATETALNEKVEIVKDLKSDTAAKAQEIDLLTLERSLNQKLNKQQKQINSAKSALQEAEIERINFQKIMSFIISLIIGMAAVWVFILYKNKRRANAVLREQKEEIVTQAEIIEEKNTEIIDSINYARRIQDSILVPEDTIQKYLPESFIYYQPKDIVSGDFYWFSKVKDEIIIAAIDCTGHGVPGAFMSLIGNMLLNEIVNEKLVTKPDLILKRLHIGVMAALKQSGDSSADDGMDMSLCTINPRLKRFQFAGAKNHLYVLQGEKLKVLKANHHSVGGRPLRSDIIVDFTSYDFMYDENTMIYMMSDGYVDQFGGLKDTKFNSKRFKQMLIDNRELPMGDQKRIIQETLTDWKGEREQVDDILVMGIKLK